ncbi:MAG: hypothetical protein ACYC5A_02535 [Thermoleophilia bacterium]
MRFAIREIYGDSLASIRRSPAVLFPAAMSLLVPYLVAVVFMFPGAESGSLDAAVILVSATYAAMSVASMAGNAWTMQAAAAEVRDGSLTLRGSLRLIGGGTVRVAASYLIVVLFVIIPLALAALFVMQAADSIAGLVLLGIIALVTMAFLMTFFSLVPSACAYERSGPWEAVTLGTMAVRPAFRSVIVFLLATIIGVSLISLAILYAADQLVAAYPGSQTAITVFNTCLSILWTAIYSLALVHIYARVQSQPETSSVTIPDGAGFSDSSPVL